MSTLDAPAAPSPAFEAFCAARDQLIALREDHARAVAEFTFPDVGDRFNWAIDWFDVIARGNDRTALVIVEDDGSSRELTFDALAARSRVACQATPVDLQATIWGVPLRRVLIWIVVVPWLTSLFLQTATGAVIQGRERAAGELAAAVSRPLIWIPIIGLASFVLATVVTNSIQMARELRSAVVCALVFLVAFGLLTVVGMVEAGSSQGWSLVIWAGVWLYFVFLTGATAFVTYRTDSKREVG